MDITELEELIDSDVTAENNEEPVGTSTLIPDPSDSQIELLLLQLSQGYLKIYSIVPYAAEHNVTVTDDAGNLTTYYTVANPLLLRIKRAAEQYAASQGAGVSPNSASLEFDETTSRFNGAIWYNKITEQNIILAGLGGIGSWTAVLLGRMKPALLGLYDPDVVERSNMSGQLFGASEIGYSKAVSMRKIVCWLSDYFPKALDIRYGWSSPAADIMICGFDNMESRQLFYKKWKAHVRGSEDKKKCLFIDGRLAAESLQVFAITGDDTRAMELYEEKWLFNDSEAEATVCSYKQTSFMSNMIASIITNIFVNFVANQCDPPFPREVPFFTEYDAATMFLKIES
jgi:hypothetical protein